ncbi:hypothetical protein ACFYO1_13215 [Nocardia sp. NPDC006044]|uniref:hypothetical protein n=1 Tax=Nocardia sp. NPDC006044 TaxID=3364306 RepID=UPI0036AF2653
MQNIWGNPGFATIASAACFAVALAVAAPESAAAPSATKEVQIVCGKHLYNGDAWYGNCSPNYLEITYSMFWDGNVPRCAGLGPWEDRDLGLAGAPDGVDYDNIHVGC